MFANPIPPLSSNRPKMRFPSPFLVVLHVISCFLVSAALVSSFTQLGTWYPYFIVPSTIGFLATLPFHIHLYLVAKEHPKSPTSSNPIFITRPWLVIGFILIPLWVIIFYINILFCVGTENPTYTGVVITTVWSGLEWIVLLCISLRTMVEVWKAEKQEHLNLASSQPETTVERRELPGDEPPSKPNYIYFFSFALCTLALLFSISLSLVCPFNVIAFFLTGPHHIALFVASVRRGGSTPSSSILFRPTSVPYAFLLAAVWCGTLVLDILCSRFEPWQVVLLVLFATMECIIVGYLSIRGVLDSLAEGQIRL